MKTTLFIVVTAALVFAVARAQFESTRPPVALPEPASGSVGPERPARPGAAASEPSALPPVTAAREATAAAPAGVPSGFGSATQNLFGVSAAGPAQRTAAPGTPVQPSGNIGPMPAAQMLRESDFKVLRQHYEKVLKEILEAEEKLHLATTDSTGDSKAQPDEDAGAHRERANVLRRYADRLRSEIAAKAGLGAVTATPLEGVPGMGTLSSIVVSPEPSFGSEGSATSPVASSFGSTSMKVRGQTPSATARDTRDASDKIAVLAAQVRAQRAALAAEQVTLEEARENWTRVEALYAEKLISAEELTRNKFAVKKSEVRMAQIEAEIAATETELAMLKDRSEKPATRSWTPAAAPQGGLAPTPTLIQPPPLAPAAPSPALRP